MQCKLLTLLVLTTGIWPVNARADIIAFDLFQSASLNLTGHTNPYANAFSSQDDGFQVYRRGVSPSIPAAVLDDSLFATPGDSIGIIDESNLDSFFGVADTENRDNSGPVSARWDFAVSGFADLALSIDMGAMGDFEVTDFFRWSWSLDGGLWTTLFESGVDETATRRYHLAGGGPFDLADPVTVGGVLLSNDMQTFSGPLTAFGDVLSLELTAQANGGNEAFAFQNLIVNGTRNTVAIPEPGALLLFATGLIGLFLARRGAG